jgi:hypothetical protein
MQGRPALAQFTFGRYLSLTGTSWRFVFDGIQCYFFSKLLTSGLILFFLSDRVEGGVCVSR